MMRHKALPVTLLLGSTLFALGMVAGESTDRSAAVDPGGAGSDPGARIEALGMTVSGPQPGTGDAGSARVDDPGADCRECPDGPARTTAADGAVKDSGGNLFERIGVTMIRAAAKVCVCVLEYLLRWAADQFPIDAVLKGLD